MMKKTTGTVKVKGNRDKLIFFNRNDSSVV